ncbi:MAG: hypothetical protein MUE80_09175, partial [Acidobacteria bacterium]|nr:hypothetical protein [Acidobacteriota bacterium]
AAVAQAQVTADDLNLLTWRWVGPVNFSGRISEFAVPPGQTTTYYVLAASGGVWKTEDAGTHFEPIFDKYGNMSMGSLAVAASDPKVLYLGTGEPMHARSSSHGNGVWKSTDAGKTWTSVGLAKSYFINKVQVHPKNPDVVYVAAEGKLYDNEMDCERGFYVTADGGKTWERRWPLADRGVGDFVVDPRDFNVVIAQAYKTYRRSWTYISTWGWPSATAPPTSGPPAASAGAGPSPRTSPSRPGRPSRSTRAWPSRPPSSRRPPRPTRPSWSRSSTNSWPTRTSWPNRASTWPSSTPRPAWSTPRTRTSSRPSTRSTSSTSARPPRPTRPRPRAAFRSPTATSWRCSTAASCSTSSPSSAPASSTARPTSARPGPR